MRHPSLQKLLAYHYNKLSATEKAALHGHIESCAFCLGNLSLLIQPEQSLKIPPASTGAPVAAKTKCLTAEAIGKYINHELVPLEFLEAEKHLAWCDSCRRQLIELVQVSIEPVSEEEKKILETAPPLEISEQVQKVMALMPKTATTSSWLERVAGWIYPHIPELAPQTSARKLALAAGIIAVICVAGYQPFRNWQAERHAGLAITEFQKIWTITDDELRPAEDFRQSIFSPTHSAAETPGADTVEIEFMKALQWNKNNRAARRGLATLRGLTGDLKTADSLIALLLEENSRDFAAWNNRGVMAARREDSTAALVYFEKALQIRPDNAIAAYNRADLLFRLGRRDEAVQAWQNFLKLDSQSEWAQVARRRLRDLVR
jgi:predicted negative regulator of RcsB-dependent stress response